MIKRDGERERRRLSYPMRSVASREVWFSTRSRVSSGRREMKLTTPPSAVGPYSADAAPLMTSTCARSTGGIWRMPSPSVERPNSGRPSESNCVYRPRRPWIRTLAPPSDGPVATTRTPLVSLSSIDTLPGDMLTFSASSSLPSTSTRVGSSSTRRLERVELTVTFASARACSTNMMVSVVSSPTRSVSTTLSGRKPILRMVATTRPGGAWNVATPPISDRTRSAPTATRASGTGCESRVVIRTRTRGAGACAPPRVDEANIAARMKTSNQHDRNECISRCVLQHRLSSQHSERSPTESRCIDSASTLSKFRGVSHRK